MADEQGWPGKQSPYGLPFFRDDAGEIRPGVVVMPAGGGAFWTAIAHELRDVSPRGYAQLLAIYPDGAGGVLSTVGAGSRKLAARMRAAGYSTLDELQAHYAGSEDPISPMNYVWFQYRFQRLAAKMFEADGEDGLVRFWDCFHATRRVNGGDVTAASLAPLLSTDVSRILGRAIRDWR